MKKNFIVAILFALVFTSCNIEPTKYEYEVDNTNNNRFQIIYLQNGPQIQIMLDKETGVKYLLIENAYGAAITKLEE